jgi:hypothetical protein
MRRIQRINNNKNKEKQTEIKAYILPEVAKRKPLSLMYQGVAALAICV